jgi:hypothetical protein
MPLATPPWHCWGLDTQYMPHIAESCAIEGVARVRKASAIIAVGFMAFPCFAGDDRPLPPEIVVVRTQLVNLENAIGEMFATERAREAAYEARLETAMEWLKEAQKKDPPR